MELIKLFAFMLSIYGYILLGYKKWKIDIEFLPAIIFSSIGCTVFLSGILNIMDIAFWGIFLAGICLAIYYIIKHDAKIKVPFGIFFCVGLLVYLLFFLKDIRYTHYDNFTHWGLVVKNIFHNSRFPNFEDEIIKFQSYPLGSACFIWYVCKIIGYSEGNTLFAQAMLILSCAATMFVMCKNAGGIKKIILSILIAFECMIWITYGANVSNGLFQLLVDILLSTVAIAAFTIVYYYRKNISKAYICVLPLITFEVCIKNSGFMWVLAILVEVLYFSIILKTGKKQIWNAGVAIVGLPMIFRKLWDAHVSMVFVNGNESLHAMTLENWTNMYNQKTEESIQKITQLFIEQVFSITNTALLQVILFIAFAIVLYILNKQIFSQSHLLFGAFFLIGVYAIYQVGNYIMYIFSMPTEEAVKFAGYDRYAMTVGFFIFGVILVYFYELFNLFSLENNVLKKYAVVVMTILILGIFVGKSKYVNNIFVYSRSQWSMLDARFKLDEIVEKYQLSEGKTSVVYIDSNDKLNEYNYYGLIAKFILYSNDITIIEPKDVDMLNETDNYDYAIILKHDDTIDNWLASSSLPFENGECLNMENYRR